MEESEVLPAETDIYTEIPTKLQKFRFIKLFVASLLMCVLKYDVHRAVHGSKAKLFAKLVHDFLPLVHPSQWRMGQKQSVKTLRYRFLYLMTNWKAANDRNERASGITENILETGQLLDYFLLQQKEHEEEIKEKKMGSTIERFT